MNCKKLKVEKDMLWYDHQQMTKNVLFSMVTSNSMFGHAFMSKWHRRFCPDLMDRVEQFDTVGSTCELMLSALTCFAVLLLCTLPFVSQSFTNAAPKRLGSL